MNRVDHDTMDPIRHDNAINDNFTVLEARLNALVERIQSLERSVELEYLIAKDDEL